MPLADYSNRVNAELAKLAEKLGPVVPLREACRYALLSPGKRIRPLLSLAIADALGKGLDVMPAALSVELFHAASLVADDLPCMDDDDERRGRASVHRKYGEAMALLVTYSLIAAGYAGICQNVDLLRYQGVDADRVGLDVMECAAVNTGVFGVVGGQLLDLSPPARDADTLRQVMAMKTGSLFEISFVVGWLFGGGDRDQLDRVKSLAGHYGLAFQIADDLGDVIQDAERSTGINLAVDCGCDEARRQFEEESVLFRAELDFLGLRSPDLEATIAMLEESVGALEAVQ